MRVTGRLMAAGRACRRTFSGVKDASDWLIFVWNYARGGGGSGAGEGYMGTNTIIRGGVAVGAAASAKCPCALSNIPVTHGAMSLQPAGAPGSLQGASP